MTHALPDKLQQILKECAEHITKDPEGKLPLGMRERIWSALGPKEMNSTRAVVGPGLLRRTALARLCAKKVLPVWEAAYPKATLVAEAFSAAEKYFRGDMSWDALWNVKDNLFALLESSWVADTSAQYAGGAVACMVGIAAHDEQFEQDSFDTTGKYTAEDRYDWDCAFYAACAFCGELERPADELPAVRRKFWQWYVLEAVPEAWTSSQ